MQTYGNLSQTSGVVAYEPGRDSITVVFANGATYLYTAESAGRAKVHRMKSLAKAGRGLSSFIARHVGKAYARRMR